MRSGRGPGLLGSLCSDGSGVLPATETTPGAHPSPPPDQRARLPVDSTPQEFLYSGTVAEPRADAERPVRVGGLAAMRALAHPTRVRMMHLLRTEALSASELARRLQIRFGSAQHHLRTLERAGIARRIGQRRNRGGIEILFEVPHSLWVDLDSDAPPGMREAVHHAYLAELQRRLDAAAAEPEPEDTDRDVFSTREVELRPEDLPAVTEALHTFLHRLDEIALERPISDSMPFTASVQLFRIPRSASARPGNTEGSS